LNCHEYIGDVNYCPHCGQLNTDNRLTVRQFIKEFIGDYFTFDSKFFRSLIPLLFKPGHLTKEYISGRRANYIYPLRLYIFTTFLFFFIVTVNTKIDRNYFSGVTVVENTAAKDSVVSILNKYGTSLPADLRQEIVNQIDSSMTIAPKKETTNTGFKFNSTSDNRFINYLQKKAKYLSSMGKKGATLFWKEVINQIPKILFLLLPVFALLLKLLYIRHKILYVEHLIFSLHVHTFLFLYLAITVFFPNKYVILFTVIGLFLHLFLSFKNVYRQSYIKTFVKMNFLLFLYSIFMLPAFLLLVFLAVVSV